MYAIALSSGRAEILRGWCLKGKTYTKAKDTSCATQCARHSTDQKAWKWIYGCRFESMLSKYCKCLIAPVMFLELQLKICELVNEIERVHN